MEIIRIVVRAVVVAAPLALVPLGDADIGGAGLVLLASLAIAAGWAAYDGRKEPSRRAWLRWTAVTLGLAGAALVKSLVQDDALTDAVVGFALIGGLFGAAAAAGVGIGSGTRPTAQAHP